MNVSKNGHSQAGLALGGLFFPPPGYWEPLLQRKQDYLSAMPLLVISQGQFWELLTSQPAPGMARLCGLLGLEFSARAEWPWS